MGFETNEAGNGVEAIKKFEDWDPHLILMDMRMPVMDGYEAAKIIKSMEKGKTIPIIALTASVFEEDNKKIQELDIQGYIRKPFREEKLFGLIGDILDLKYIYEEDDNISSEEKYLNDEIKINKDIKRIPDNLILQMQEAVSVADLDLLIELINSIDSDNSDLGHYLKSLAENYQYNDLQKILKITEK